MREPAYSPDAPRQTVSLTINSDLFSRAKALGINASRIAEQALAAEVERLRRARIAAEVTADVDAETRYVERHGSFADLAREHYATKPRTKRSRGKSVK